MTIDVHFRTAAAAVALSAVLSPSLAFAVGGDGALLLYRPANRQADAWIVDLDSRRETPLPRSAVSQARSEKKDTWYGSVLSDTLVRVDRKGSVDLFDRRSITRIGGFSPAHLPGVDQPMFYGPVKPSPDGRKLLTYWLANYRGSQPTITVFDRQGNIVDSGSPYRYERSAHSQAFDWLPDGSFIYLAGNKLVLRKLADKVSRVASISIPGNVSTRNAKLAVSPDGQRLLWSLAATLKNKSGSDLVHNLLYVSNLDGSKMRPLTTLTPRAQRGLIRWIHSKASWSPTGDAVAFTSDTAGAYGAMPCPGGSGCPKVLSCLLTGSALRSMASTIRPDFMRPRLARTVHSRSSRLVTVR